MTTTDLRLKYQKETGLGLDFINNLVENPTINIEVECLCPECSELFEINEDGDVDPDFVEYVKWLEESLIQMFKLHKHILDKSQPHLY